MKRWVRGLFPGLTPGLKSFAPWGALKPGALAAAKKRPPEPRRRDTIRRREDNCQERTGDRTNGGSRYRLIAMDRVE